MGYPSLNIFLYLLVNLLLKIDLILVVKQEVIKNLRGFILNPRKDGKEL